MVKTIGQRRARRISGGHRNAVSRAVVRAFVVRSHEVEIVSFLDGQLTGSVGYVIVLSNTAYNSCTRRNHTRIYIHIGSLTVQGDARQCVARGKAVCVQRHLGSNRGGIGVGDVVLTLSRSVVGVLLILGRDGQRSRVDLHGAEHRRHMVLAAHIHSVVTDVVGGIVVLHRTLRDVCHGVACEVNRQDIAVRQSHIIVSQSAMPAEVVGSCHREGKRVVRLTIIRPLLSSRRKRDIYRRAIAHRQGARYERDVVVALVGEVEGRGIHRGGHAALRRIGDTAVDYHSPSRRTGRLVCISPALHRIGVAVLSLTGIGQVGGTCRDGHRAFGNGQIVVAEGILIIVVGGLYIDRRRTHIGSLRNIAIPIGAVVGGAVGKRGTCHVACGRGGVLTTTVIHLRDVCRTGHRHHGGSLVDGHITVLNDSERHRSSEIGVRIGELVLCSCRRTFQAHIRRTDIGTGHGSGIGTCKGGIGVERVGARPSIAGSGIGITVIQVGEVITRDVHRNSIRHRRNGQLTVCHLERRVVIAVVVGELTLRQVHVGCTFIGAGDRGVTTEGEVILGVGITITQVIGKGNVIALGRLLTTIVNFGFLLTGNIDGNVLLVHRQRAGHRSDVVVIRQSTIFERIGEGVGRRTRSRLRTRDGVCSTLIRHKAVARNSDISLCILRKSGAVVVFAIRSRGQRDITFGNGQRTVNRVAEGVAVGHVLIAMFHLIGGHAVGSLAVVGAAAFHCGGQRITFFQHILRIGIGILGQSRTVVFLTVIISGDHNRRGDRVDGQCTRGHHKRNLVVKVVVVVGEIRHAQRHGIGSCLHARSGLMSISAIIRNVRFMIKRIADVRHCIARHRLRPTVVGLGVRGTHDCHGHHIRRVHRQGAEDLGRVIIGFLDSAWEGKLELVVLRSDSGSGRPSSVVGGCNRAVAGNPTVHCHIMIGVSSIIESPAIRSRGQRERSLGDDQMSRILYNIVGARHIHRTVFHYRGDTGRLFHFPHRTCLSIIGHMGIAALQFHIETIAVVELVVTFRTHCVALVVVGQRITFGRKRSAVIHLGGARRLDVQRADRCSFIDLHLKSAVHRGDGIVGWIARSHLGGHHIGAGTRQGLRTGNRHSNLIRVERQRGRIHRVSSITVGLTVVVKGIRARMGSRRHCHGQRVDGQRAVLGGHVVLARHVLRAVGDRIIQNLVIHRGRRDMRDLALHLHFQLVAIIQRYFGSAIGGGIFCFCTIPNLHFHLIIAVRCSVIRPRAIASGDGEVGLGAPIHRQRAVHRGDVVVSISCRDGHRLRCRAFARIGDGTGNRIAHRILIRCIHKARLGNRIFCILELSRVMQRLVHRRDGSLLLVDDQLTVRNTPSHMSEISIRAGETVRIQAHIIGTCIGLIRDLIRISGGEIHFGKVEERVAAALIVSGNAMGIAIVCQLIGMTGNSNRDIVNRVDFECTVHKSTGMRGIVVTAHIIRAMQNADHGRNVILRTFTHGGDTTLHLHGDHIAVGEGISAYAVIVTSNHRVGVGHTVCHMKRADRQRMGIAVIGPGTAACCQGQFNRVRVFHFQFTIHKGDVVVALGVSCESMAHNAVRHRALGRVLDLAEDIHTDGVIPHESLRESTGHFIGGIRLDLTGIRQGIVLTFQTGSGGHRHVALVDAKGTVHKRLDGVGPTHVVSTVGNGHTGDAVRGAGGAEVGDGAPRVESDR